MKVLVCGGGIGGLALALSLHAVEIDVEVFEAAPEIEELGVGINVLPHAVRELTELGLADELADAGLATSELVLCNKHGQRIWAEPTGLAEGYHWPQYSIHRGRLLGLLYRACLDRLGEDRIHTGRRVEGYSDEAANPLIQLADGTSAEGDVVVGADGIGSAMRLQMYPDEGAPLWNGVTMWRAVAVTEPPLTGESMVIIGNQTKRTVIYPLSKRDGDGRALVNVIMEAKTAEAQTMPRQDWNHEADPNEVRELFGGTRFDWIDVDALIDAAEQWLQYPMVDRDPLPRWSFGRTTLMGDAAHPMYPVGSNGASQAIVDARTLARALAVEPDAEAALGAYESERLPATAAVVQSNRELGAVKCLEVAEERAPEGFTSVEDVFAPGELEGFSSTFKQIAGFDPAALNERASLSVT